jgi:TfoX/Sxy family transcriptional regulator of competence genes
VSKPPIPAETLALYEELVATNPEVPRRGASVPYTSVNGHMFSFLTEAGLALRLPAEERQAFLEEHESQLSVQHGIVMKEYVDGPPTLLSKTRELQKYFELSYAYVSSLKPKPTKRTIKKAATAKNAGE